MKVAQNEILRKAPKEFEFVSISALLLFQTYCGNENENCDVIWVTRNQITNLCNRTWMCAEYPVLTFYIIERIRYRRGKWGDLSSGLCFRLFSAPTKVFHHNGVFGNQLFLFTTYNLNSRESERKKTKREREWENWGISKQKFLLLCRNGWFRTRETRKKRWIFVGNNKGRTRFEIL